MVGGTDASTQHHSHRRGCNDHLLRDRLPPSPSPAPSKAFQFAMMVTKSVSSVRGIKQSVTTGRNLPKAVVRLARAVPDSEHLGAVDGGRAARVSLHGSFARRSDFWRRFRRRAQRVDAQPPIELIRVWCGTLSSASPYAISLAARASKDDLA